MRSARRSERSLRLSTRPSASILSMTPVMVDFSRKSLWPSLDMMTPSSIRQGQQDTEPSGIHVLDLVIGERPLQVLVYAEIGLEQVNPEVVLKSDHFAFRSQSWEREK